MALSTDGRSAEKLCAGRVVGGSMSNGWVLPDEVLRDAPAYTPRPHELADLELLLTGAYAPLTGFLGRADLSALARRGRLADGTPWPVPVTLRGAGAGGRAAWTSPTRCGGRWSLTDLEDAPVALLEVTDVWPTRDGMCGVGGTVRQLGDGGHGPFQRLRRSPAEVRELLPPGRVLGVITDRPLHRPQLAQIAHAARTLAAHLLILIPVDRHRPGRAAARGAGPQRVRGPRPDAAGHHGRRPAGAPGRRDPRRAAARPGGRRVRGDPPALHRRDALRRRAAGAGPARAGLRQPGRAVAVARRHPAAQPAAGAAARTRSTTCSTGASRCPSGTLHRRWPGSWPGPGRRAGTAGWWSSSPASPAPASRRSPVAWPTRCGRAATGRSPCSTATWCAGSCPPGSASARPTGTCNVRRIGWVAAEVARHRGLAICCPIAPYAQARATARQMAAAAGAGFLLVHVATPLEVCEQRDRKGLYARARAGQITRHDRDRRPVRGADRRRSGAGHQPVDGRGGGPGGADAPDRDRLGGAPPATGLTEPPESAFRARCGWDGGVA